MANAPTPVELWFDPMCPWAWITSRWLINVSKERDLDITWSVMSLAVLNEGREIPPQYADAMAAAWGPVRLCIAARDQYGPHVVGDLYTALGTRLHVDGRSDYRVIMEESLGDAGLPSSLIGVVDSSDRDALVRASHQRAINLVGSDVGTPVIAVPGPSGQPVAFFGPIVTPAPRGEQAVQLWDGALLVAGTPGFFELKRSRDEEPRFD